jgi:hypothetical protein
MSHTYHWSSHLRAPILSNLVVKPRHPYPCQLKTDRVAPVNKIDYVLTHMGLWGPTNFTDVHWDSVWATQCCPLRLLFGRHALGRSRTWSDSLIIIANGAHSCCLHGSRVSYYLVISLQDVYQFESPWHPQSWVMLVRCSHSVEVPIHYGHMRFMVMLMICIQGCWECWY